MATFARAARAFVLTSAVLLVIPSSAHAYSGGVSSTSFVSSTGCNACHTGGSTPSVSFQFNGASTTSVRVPRGGEITLNFLLSTPAGQGYGGFHVQSTNSTVTLSAGGPAVKSIIGTSSIEVTHNSRQAAVGGSISFPFKITANSNATCSSTSTLIGWGNAVNGNGATTGNQAAKTSLQVVIECPPAESSSTSDSGGTTAAQPVRLSAQEASQILTTWLTRANYYRMPMTLFSIKAAEKDSVGYLFDVQLTCTTTFTDRWRVDATTSTVMRRNPRSGRYDTP